MVVPRFSTTAFVSVLALIGTGIGQSLLELPTLGSLWETNYGKALVVKIVLLFAALALAAVNLAADEAPARGGRRAPVGRRRRRRCCFAAWSRARSCSSRERSSRRPSSPASRRPRAPSPA